MNYVKVKGTGFGKLCNFVSQISQLVNLYPIFNSEVSKPELTFHLSNDIQKVDQVSPFMVFATILLVQIISKMP